MLKEMDLYSQIAFYIVLVGGICWLFVGLFDILLITSIFGTFIARLVYLIVGLAAGWLIYRIYVEKTTKLPPQV